MLAAETALTMDAPGRDLKTLMDEYERQLIVAALGASGGQQNRAASMLGVLPTTLHEKMKRLGIHRGFGDLAEPGSRTVVLTQPSQVIRWNGLLAPGSTLEIKGTMGRIHAVAAEGDEAEVVALRSAGSAPGQVAVNVLEHEDGAIFSVYHSKATTGPDTPGARERAASILGRLRVDFELRLPVGIHLTARLYSGNIEVTGVTGRVDAHTMNGIVRISPNHA
jgi:hypothetical protein